MVSSHILWPLMGVFKKICKVFLLDLMNNISVNNVYVKYISIYTCSLSKLCLFQNSMIFPWAADPKFNDFSMIFSFLQILRTFHVIQWFFHDLETDFLPFSYKFSAILLQVFCHSPTSLLTFSYKFSAILLQVFCHYPLLTTEPDKRSFCSPPGNPTGHCSRSMCR